MRLNKSSLAVLVALGALTLANQGALAVGPIPIPGEVLVSFQLGQRVQVNKNTDGVHTGITALDVVLDRHGVTDLESAFGANVDKFADPATRADLVRHYLVRHDNKVSNDALIADLTGLDMVASAESNLLLPPVLQKVALLQVKL